MAKLMSEDVWHRCDNNIDFLLKGNETEYWNKFLESQNISYEVLLEDVQRTIEKEDLMKHGDWRRDGKINWATYPKLKDIYEYLKNVAAANPNYCSLKTIGKTVLKNDIMMLKISNGKSENEAFLIEAGMHGREWTSVISLLYFVEHLAWNFTKHPSYIEHKDWYLIPLVNPDGYEYSMTKDRLWRKNRRRFSGPCDGVDINRNFDFGWGKMGACEDICSITYCGPVAFSEQESIAIRNVVTSRHFTGYASIHSYGSAVLFPWVSSGEPSANAPAHLRVAKEMVMAMRAVDDEHYQAGTVSLLHLNKGTGSAVDWAFSQGSEYSFAVETRAGQNNMFTLGDRELMSAMREVTAGLKKMAEVIRS